MTLVATMPTSPNETPQEFCTYISVKIDTDVLPVVKAAAALQRKSVQDYLSDLANAGASKDLGRKPVKRKPSKD